MFHNPFNSKVVADITKFLSENRKEIDITPCLNEKAADAADAVAASTTLEGRRNVLVHLFNEAVSECRCLGTTKEANDFSKAVDFHIESKKVIVPAGKVTNPAHDENELETSSAVAKKTAKPTSKSNLGTNDGLAGKGKNPPKIGG